MVINCYNKKNWRSVCAATRTEAIPIYNISLHVNDIIANLDNKEP